MRFNEFCEFKVNIKRRYWLKKIRYGNKNCGIQRQKRIEKRNDKDGLSSACLSFHHNIPKHTKNNQFFEICFEFQPCRQIISSSHSKELCGNQLQKDTMPLKKICPFPSTLITYRKNLYCKHQIGDVWKIVTACLEILGTGSV